MIVFLEVSSYQCIYLFIFDILVIFHQFAYRTVIYVVTHTLFSFHFITIGYSYVVHLVAETDNQHIL